MSDFEQAGSFLWRMAGGVVVLCGLFYGAEHLFRWMGFAPGVGVVAVLVSPFASLMLWALIAPGLRWLKGWWS
jgi:hypothetical protein